MRHLLLCLLLFAAPALAGAAEESAVAGPVTRIAWAWIELDAAGQVTAVEQDAGQNPIIAGVLEEQARRLRFAPARVDGIAVASAVPLELTLRFVPLADGGLRPELLDARVFAARGQALVPPRYPPEAAVAGIGGFVRLAMTVGTDGKPDPGTIVVQDSGFFGTQSRRGDRLGEQLVAAATAAAAQWTWRNARIGDERVAVRLTTPTTFRPPEGAQSARLPDALAERAALTPPMELVDPRQHLPLLIDTFPDAPDAAGRAAIEVSATRVRRP